MRVHLIYWRVPERSRRLREEGLQKQILVTQGTIKVNLRCLRVPEGSHPPHEEAFTNMS